MIRKVFCFGRAPDMSILSGAPECCNRGNRLISRALVCFVGMLILASGLFTSCPEVAFAAPPEGAEQGTAAPEQAAAPKSESAEAWDAIKNTTNPALLEAFINRYGTTFFAEIAKARLDELKAASNKPPATGVTATSTNRTRLGNETAQSQFLPPVLQIPADTVHEPAVLYEEDSNGAGRQFKGSVVWHTESIKVDGKPDEFAASADVDIPSRGLSMTLSFKRNLDSSLAAGHVIDLRFTIPSDFDGGGIASVPGILMKSNQRAHGTPLTTLSVKVANASFLVGLSNATADDRERNLKLVLERSWFDIPVVYADRRRAILAIGKGELGDQIFKAVFAAWEKSPIAMSIPERNSNTGNGQ